MVNPPSVSPLVKPSLSVFLPLLLVLCFSIIETKPAFNIKQTIQDVPVSNGLGSGWINIQQERLVGLRTELYGYENAYSSTADWCYDSYFGVYQKSSGSVSGNWLPEAPGNASWSYVDGTSIVSLFYPALFSNLDVSSYFFLPFSADSSLFVMLLKIQNYDSASRNFLVHSLMNFKLGNGENIYWKTDSTTKREYFFENGANFRTVYYPLPSSVSSEFIHQATPFDVYTNGRSEWTQNSTDYSNYEVTPGFQWGTSIQGNQEQWFGFVIHLGASDMTEINAFLSKFGNQPTAKQVYDAELQWWSDWHSVEKMPTQQSQYYDSRLFRQSTAVLKMAQNRKSGKGQGQILASLPPGMWDIGWVRDGAYSSMALSVSNHVEESRLFLNFLQQSDVGYYKNFWYNGKDWGVGVDYGVSVCRYYGNGTEWSDGDNDPNIELDGYGLILVAIDTWYNQTKDLSQVQKWWSWIQKLVNPIVYNLNPNNLVTVSESGIWERHLSGARQFSNTAATALAGLSAACHLSLQLNGYCPTQWTETQQQMLKGFPVTFSQLGWVKGEAEDNEVDGSAIESFNLQTGLVDYNNLNLWINTTNVMTTKLAFSSTRPWGFKRRETGDWYDTQEWLFMDLRIAAAQRTLNKEKYKNPSYTSDTESWVVEQARANGYVLPELINGEGRYDGAIPMAGFGAGAWILLQFTPYQ